MLGPLGILRRRLVSKRFVDMLQHTATESVLRSTTSGIVLELCPNLWVENAMHCPTSLADANVQRNDSIHSHILSVADLSPTS
jgi:hypothetical protein